MKIAHCLQHVPFEGPGAFHAILEQHGFEVHPSVVPEQGVPAALGDFLLIMGGPMSVNDPHPWIAEELVFIQQALSQEIPIVGVCLGSQLLTRALGSLVTASSQFEIGMVPITLSEEGQRDPVFSAMPQTFDVFQWHGEGFQLPEKTVLLASSAKYPVQAFRYGRKVYALLFHLEMEARGIEILCQECPDDVVRGGIARETLVATAREALPQLHSCADRLIGHLASIA